MAFSNGEGGSGDRAGGNAAREVVVIGGGPAGVAAAVQLKRSGLDPLVFERDRIGGLLREAYFVENYPGFPEGIAGSDLADLLAAHLRSARVDVASEEVVRLDREDGVFTVCTPSREVRASTVVIASGTRPKLLEGVKIADAAERSVRYCVTALEEMRDGTVAVIGGGEAAHDYALNLARRNDVIVLHRSDRRRCIPVLRERCDASPRISFRPRTVVERIAADPRGVVLHVRERGGEGAAGLVRAEAVLVAIGRIPRLGFLGGGLVEKLDVLRRAGRLYLVGDVAGGDFRQAAISAGGGVRVAMEIRKRHEGDRENGNG